MPLAPPPTDKVFPSFAELFAFVQAHAAREGYAVNSKGQTKDKETGVYKRHVIRCDKSGTFKSHAQLGTRRIGSKKTDCPFSAASTLRPEGCYLKVLVPEHNHPPSAIPAAHVQHRKFTEEQRRLVETGAIERKSVRVIHEEIKALDPDTYITFKDVDNAVQKFRRMAKNSATGVQAIMYKLAERQDLYCFTLEKEGTVQGAFWVPRWSSELWTRNNGTPDILVMMTENISNQPILPILEMNSVLNIAGFGSAPPPPPPSFSTPPVPPTPIQPDTPVNPEVHASASSPDNPSTADSPAPSTSAPQTPVPGHTRAAPSATIGSNMPARSNNGIDPALGAGYAILPDKSDATLVWLLSAVEKLRGRIGQCPKPRFMTLTDFHTVEKNILIEVSKGGVAHRQRHVVFGRFLDVEEGNQVHQGVRTRKPREERPARASQGQGDDGNSEYDSTRGDLGVEGTVGGEVDDVDEEGMNDEDQDMEEDQDSDAEIARQLTAHAESSHASSHNVYQQPQQLQHPQNPQHPQQPSTIHGHANFPPQHPLQHQQLSPQQQQHNPGTPQLHDQNPGSVRLPPPDRARTPSLLSHSPVHHPLPGQVVYNAEMMAGMQNNMMNRQHP
jgi:hypothetical protein